MFHATTFDWIFFYILLETVLLAAVSLRIYLLQKECYLQRKTDARGSTNIKVYNKS